MLKIIPWNERPVERPGIYSGIPIDRYHAMNCCKSVSISSTGLRRLFAESPAHYWAFSIYNKDRYDEPTSEALLLGGATHHLLLGEQNFKAKYAKRPNTMGGVRWSGQGACKVWLNDRRREGRQVILSSQMERIEGMARSLRREPLIQAGILNGYIETSFIWFDADTGIWLKARPDAAPSDSLDFADLKITRSIIGTDLRRSIFEYGYYQQAALVSEGCFKLTGQRMNSFSLVFVESVPPHCVAVLTMKDEDIERGHRANAAALKIFADCLREKTWPGPWGNQRDAAYIEMNSWDQAKIDRRLEEINAATG